MDSTITNLLQSLFTPKAITLGRVVTSLLAVFLLWLSYRLVARVIHRRIKDEKMQFFWLRIANYFAFGLGILWLGQIWLEGFGNLAAFVGLLTAVLAIALRELINNIAGWVYIMMSRPFTIGDRIQVGAIAGDVVDLKLTHFVLMEIGNWVDGDQGTGRMTYIPNGRIFTIEVANYNAGPGYIWNEIPVVITTDSDWKSAKDILEGIINQYAGGLDVNAMQIQTGTSPTLKKVFADPRPSVHTSVMNTSARGKGILMTMRYLCRPEQRRESTDVLWEKILQAFGERPDIRISIN